MVSIKNFLLLAVSVSAAVLPGKRDAASIQSALEKVNSDITALTGATNNYNGGGLTNALPIQSAANTLNNDVKSATSTTSGSDALSDADASSIISYVTGTLQGSTGSAIDALISKKSNFDTDGASSIVESTLKTTLTNVNALADALVAKAPSGESSAASSAKSAIVGEVQRGVDAFA